MRHATAPVAATEVDVPTLIVQAEPAVTLDPKLVPVRVTTAALLALGVAGLAAVTVGIPGVNV